MARAQQPALPTPPVSPPTAALDGRAAAPASNWASPDDIFLACRRADRIRGGGGDGAVPQTLLAFCDGTRLPTAGRLFRAADVEPWVTLAVPTRDEIQRAAVAERRSIREAARDFLKEHVRVLEYNVNSSALSDQEIKVLARLAAYLRVDPRLRLRVSTYADATGSDSANREVTARRLRNVVRTLDSLGVDRSQVDGDPRGAGEARDAAGTRPREAQQWRRAELRPAMVEAPPPSVPGTQPTLLAAPTARPTDLAATIINGTADFLVRQARSQLQAYAVGQLTPKVCAEEKPGLFFFPSACGLLLTAKEDGALPAVVSLRTLVRRDLSGLAPRAVGFAAEQAFCLVPPPPAGAQQIDPCPVPPNGPAAAATRVGRVGTLPDVGARTVAWGAIYLGEVLGGTDPVEAFARALGPLALTGPTVRFPLDADREPMPALRNFARLAAATDTARRSIGEWMPDGTSPLDSVYLYGIRSVALQARWNAEPSDRVRTLMQTLVESARNVDALATEWRTLAASLSSRESESPAGSLSDSSLALVQVARQDARRIAAARLVSLTARTTALVVAPALPLAERERFDSAMALTRDLVAHVLGESYGEAMHSYLEVRRLIAPVGAKGLAASAGQDEVRVLGLAAELAQAGSADDVGQAMRRFTTNSSGLRRKRASAGGRNVFLNAYVGGMLGAEWVRKQGALPRSVGGIVGASVPLGIEVAIPCTRGTKASPFNPSCNGGGWGGSLGGFFQVIDLGAVATARVLGDNDVQDPPAVKFPQVLTPGVFLTRGFGMSPLALGIGGVYAPRARWTPATNVAGDDQNRGTTRPAFRLSAFLAVDLPIFP